MTAGSWLRQNLDRENASSSRPSIWRHCVKSVNGASDMTAPFGGFKMSGNGREWGDFAFHEFLEVKAVMGYAPKEAAE